MADCRHFEKNETSRYFVMIRNGSVKLIAAAPSWFFKIDFLTADALRDTFYIIVSNFAKIAHAVAEI